MSDTKEPTEDSAEHAIRADRGEYAVARVQTQLDAALKEIAVLKKDREILNRIESIYASGNEREWADLQKHAAIAGFRRAIEFDENNETLSP